MAARETGAGTPKGRSETIIAAWVTPTLPGESRKRPPRFVMMSAVNDAARGT
jgi:hypothetical protein